MQPAFLCRGAGITTMRFLAAIVCSMLSQCQCVLAAKDRDAQCRRCSGRARRRRRGTQGGERRSERHWKSRAASAAAAAGASAAAARQRRISTSAASSCSCSTLSPALRGTRGFHTPNGSSEEFRRMKRAKATLLETCRPVGFGSSPQN